MTDLCRTCVVSDDFHRLSKPFNIVFSNPPPILQKQNTRQMGLKKIEHEFVRTQKLDLGADCCRVFNRGLGIRILHLLFLAVLHTAWSFFLGDMAFLRFHTLNGFSQEVFVWYYFLIHWYCRYRSISVMKPCVYHGAFWVWKVLFYFLNVL